MTDYLLAIVGPTAVGKSQTAIDIATVFGGEIINGDSRQVYRYMDIGTGKPSLEDRCRVPHHLFDIINPDEDFNLALYKDLAIRAIRSVQERGRIPLLVGGSGMYVWSVIDNWHIPEVPPDAEFRKSMEQKAAHEGSFTLYEELRRVDPEGAARIAATNIRRIIRALEIYRATGIPPSRVKQKNRPYFQTEVIGLTMDRASLYSAINARVDRMVELGLVDEVKGLLERGYSVTLPSMSSVGYPQIVAYLHGNITLSEAIERIKVETHRFARHQYAWFRLSDKRIKWFKAGETRDGMFNTVRRFLSGEELTG